MGEARNRKQRLQQMPCAYCGGPGGTRDHVPPKCLFTGDRTNLITVPSCEAHNLRVSGLDEAFRTFVSAWVGVSTPEALQLWHDLKRGLDRSPKQKADLLSRLVTDKRTGDTLVSFSASFVQSAFERITRGLYWYHYRSHLPSDLGVVAYPLRDLTGLQDLAKDMNRRTIGGSQFMYAHQRFDAVPTVSVWVYGVHERLWALAITDTVNANTMIAIAEQDENSTRGAKP